ncbi:MAG TPA: redox-regulated ATPase YchF [Candidatus Thermoplasmatota archaeon]|nr:redox-regulated ATPase YchF [Candidatus Thermoplasmatota archaeon]
MQVGIVGKPNVGKSTFFSALTLAPAEIADYPFTTIKPNRGVGYVRASCPHAELGLKECKPKNSPCLGGMRYVPVELIDVAGLVPKAHEGRGMGNQFLDDLRPASVLIHIVDASGATDAEGNTVPAGTYDPVQDVAWLQEEIVLWIKGLLMRDWETLMRTISAKGAIKPEQVLAERLTALGIKETQVKAAIDRCGLDPLKLAEHIVQQTKPIQIAANKVDKASLEAVRALQSRGGVPTAAESELALRRAKDAGVVRYAPGDATFDLVAPDKLNDRQKKALEYIRHHVLEPWKSTGVQQCLEAAVFRLLDHIVVFPVEDETHFSSKTGDVLPDAHLLKRGATARDLAYKVHTELGEHFIRAVDARTKRVIGADHELKMGDVVRIVAGK